jgi:hypothetical protein
MAGGLLMWSTLHRETLTVLRTVPTGQVDQDGVPVVREQSTPWPGCNVQPLSTSEQTGRAERVTDRLQVSGPPIDLAAGDKVLLGGVVYRVEGQPRVYGAVMPHVEAVLVTWTGA